MTINKHQTARYPSNLITEHSLSEQDTLTVRPIRQDDIERIKAFSRHLSNELKHLNYMETFKELPQKMVTQLTQVDYKNSMTLIATHMEHGEEVVVGMVHYISLDGTNCEFDMIVTDAWQHKGVGSILTEAMLKSAKENGMKTVSIIILASNHGGMKLAQEFGFMVNNSDDPTVKIVVKQL